MPFNSNMVDHPTIPIGEIKPRLIRYLNTNDPNGQIVSIYRTNQPPNAQLTSGVNTSLLLNFNGANNSTVFTDSSGNNRTITKTGSPIISTANSKFGGSSAYFNGSSYITATIPGGLPASWTIEFWYRKTTDSGWIFTCRSGQVFSDGVDIFHDLRIQVSSIVISGISLELNRWYHVAFMRLNGSTIYRFIDGAPNGQGTATNAMTSSSFHIGSSTPTGNPGSLNGYIDDFRITNSAIYDPTIINPIPDGTLQVSYHRPSREGQLVFAASVTNEVTTAKSYVSVGPQGETFWQYDSLIMNMDGLNNSQYFTDHSKYNNTITIVGNAKLVTSTGITNSTSLYLDGLSNLKIPNDPFRFGTSNFTFEFWVNVDATQPKSYPYLFASSAYNSGGGFIIYLPGPGTGWGGTDRLYFQSSTSGAAGPDMQSTSTFKGQGWKHVAITRNGSTFRLFVNGIQEATVTNSTANFTGLTSPGSYLGAGISGSSLDANTWTKGYIDLFRVTNGACRYTSNFTPPTSYNYLQWKPTTQVPTYIDSRTGQAPDSNYLLYTG